MLSFFFFFSSRRRHTRFKCDWSSDVCSSDLLAFDLDTRDATILRVKAQEPPWRVVRGFDAPSGERLAHVHNVSGGMLDTDSLEWLVDVGPGARAQMTSTGATRVHRSRGHDRIARQSAVVKIGAGGYFEYLPDQLIPFAGCRFEQTTHVELGAGAALIWLDMVAPGREASGEVFRYESLASSFELAVAAGPVALRHWTIPPPPPHSAPPGALGAGLHSAPRYFSPLG